jgi:hypothetical protein
MAPPAKKAKHAHDDTIDLLLGMRLDIEEATCYMNALKRYANVKDSLMPSNGKYHIMRII